MKYLILLFLSFNLFAKFETIDDRIEAYANGPNGYILDSFKMFNQWVDNNADISCSFIPMDGKGHHSIVCRNSITVNEEFVVVIHE